MRKITIIASVALSLSGIARAQTLGMVEPYAFQLDNDAAHVSARLRAYRALGISSVRVGAYWSDMEPAPGIWRDSEYTNYMRTLVADGFRLTLDLETLASAPGWLYQDDPSALPVDANGLTSTTMMSYWYPGIQPLVHEATANMLGSLAANGLLCSIDAIGPSYGAADEPLYPTSGDMGGQAVSFWAYDVHAEADFPVQMQAQYGTIAAANAAWGTSYARWQDVAVPRPNTISGPLWQDFLFWYRWRKREFIAWQVRDTEAQVAALAVGCPAPAVALAVAGPHIPPDEWSAAVASGSDNDPTVVMMTDNGFLVDLAHRTGATLHVTGMPETEEIQYLRWYAASQGFAAETMTGENAGGTTPQPALYANEVLAHGLTGFEYVNADALFKADGVTTNATYDGFAAAYTSLLGQLQQSVPFSQRYPEGELDLVQGGCLSIDPTQGLSLCLSTTGVLSVSRGSQVLWTPPGDTPVNCPANTDWLHECHLTWQGDGNLVIYAGYPATDDVVWGVGNNLGGTSLVLSGTAPYVTLTADDGSVVWSSSN